MEEKTPEQIRAEKIQKEVDALFKDKAAAKNEMIKKIMTGRKHRQIQK